MKTPDPSQTSTPGSQPDPTGTEGPEDGVLENGLESGAFAEGLLEALGPYRKAVVAAIAAAALVVDAVSDPTAQTIIAAAIGVVGAFLVWFVPNRASNEL